VKMDGCMGMGGVSSRRQNIGTKMPILIVSHTMFGRFREGSLISMSVFGVRGLKPNVKTIYRRDTRKQGT
jgi:hypothetical protein